MSGQVSGLPLEYLLGETSASSTTRSDQQFYNLQAEETLSSLEATIEPEETSEDALKRKKDSLKLDVDLDPQKTHSGLIFSPGGSEAYVFTAFQEEQKQLQSEKQTKKNQQPPGNSSLHQFALLFKVSNF